MKNELDRYIDSLFCDVEKSKIADDLKDEIKADIESRYDDCIKSGMSPAAAYASSISSLGNVDMLIEEVKQKTLTLRPEEGFQIEYYTGGRIDPGETFEKLFGFITPENSRVLEGAIMSLLWILTTILYLIISFITRLWHITWIIFLVSSIASVLVALVFDLSRLRSKPYTEKTRRRFYRKIEGAVSAVMWLGVTIAYFLFSFTFGAWSISWLIFLFASAFQVVLSAVMKLLRK